MKEIKLLTKQIACPNSKLYIILWGKNVEYLKQKIQV